MIYNAMWQHKADRGAEYAARQIALSEKRQNPISDHYSLALWSLVEIRARQGDLIQLIPLWQRVIDLRRRVRGENSVPVIAGLKQLATLYRQNRQWPEAEDTDQRIAAIKLRATTDAVAALKLSETLATTMTYDRAPMLICKHENTPLDSQDPLSTARQNELCGEYAVDHDLAYAGQTFEKALLFRKAAQGVNHPDTRRTADRAIEIYMKAGKSDGANRVRAVMAQP